MAGAHPRFAEELLNAHPSGSRLLSEPLMPRSRKIDLEKVQASLDKKCPKCGFTITPDLVKRVDFERMESEMWREVSSHRKPMESCLLLMQR
jgi:hypothetical protein